MHDFHGTFRDLLHAANLRHGTDGFTSPPKEGVLSIFSPLKIRRLRPGLNPRTWVLKASTLPLDHRSRQPINTMKLTTLYICLCVKIPPEDGFRRPKPVVGFPITSIKEVLIWWRLILILLVYSCNKAVWMNTCSKHNRSSSHWAHPLLQSSLRSGVRTAAPLHAAM